MAKSWLSRMRARLVHRQFFLFGGILATGISMLVAGISMAIGTFPLEIPRSVGPHLISEGIVFITIGMVGLLMAWTTFDIGGSIKETVREVGRQNSEDIAALARSQEAMVEGIKEAVRESGKEVKEAVRESGRQNIEAIAALARSQEAMGREMKEAVRDMGKEMKEAVRDMGKEMKEAVREGIKEAARESGRQNVEAASSPAKRR